MAAIGRIEQLREAVVARRAVGRDERQRLAAARAGDDREVSVARGLQRLRAHALDGRKRRRLGRQPRQEGRDGHRVALDLEQYPALVVEHEAAELELPGEAVDVWAKADTLHDALDAGSDSSGGHGAVSTSSRRT